MQVIRIDHKNKALTIGQYVQIIRRVKASPPGTMFKESFGGWWPATREEILRQFWQMVQDRINRNSVIPAKLTDAELLALKRQHLKSECRWCGQSLGEYREKERRFCDGGCRRSYYL